VAALASSFALATGDFSPDVRSPAGEPGDVVAFMHEVIGP
jgi:hypothetical protein